MLTPTRLINFCVFFLVLAALVVGGYYAFLGHQESLIRNEEAKHQSIAQGFANNVWNLHRHKIEPLFDLTPQELADNIDMALFAEDAVRYFRGMQIDYVQFYTPTGKHLMSFPVRKSKIDFTTMSEALLKTAISSGKITTDVGNNPMQPAVANSLVPVITEASPQLWIRIATDVTQQQQYFIKILAIAAAVILLTILNIMLLNYFNIRRAEAIISRQYEDNADLVAQAAAAKEENYQKSQFLANISHELRTPLNAIIGFSDILKNEFVPSPGQNKHVNYINDIHSAGMHLLSLINDILDYSKAEAGKLELEASEINAIKMVQNCLRLVQPRADIGQVRLEENLPKDQMSMITDSKKFKQILLNLLSNAVKFTPPNGSVKVSGWFDMREDMCVFEVKDTGIGISPKDISRAMSPFGQVDNTLARKYEGTGLGLPLTKKFVELMGGKFVIESELNTGTTVTFSLPRELKAREGVIVKQVA